MKKIKITLLTSIFIISGVFSYLFLFPATWATDIDAALNSEAYYDLPEAAKDFIRDEYAETGDILRVEANKVDNEPYLNPSYVEYLALSEEEKDEVAVLPEVYLIEQSEEFLPLTETNIAASFDLRDYDGGNYITPLKNQGNLGICWAFALSEVAESYAMVNGVDNNGMKAEYDANTTVVLQPRQLDYATSTDGIDSYDNEFGARELASGGSFMHAVQVFASGLTTVPESWLDFDYLSKDQKTLAKVLNYDNSYYELNSSASFNNATAIANNEGYRNTIKELIIENGGAMVSSQAPMYSCGSSKGDDGSYVIRATDDDCDKNAYHAMQIIGWDDDYSYSYCSVNNIHYDADSSQCDGQTIYSTNGEAGTVSIPKGAWLLRNSWGNVDAAYVYLTYDSIEVSIDIFADMESSDERTWDNQYTSIFITNKDNGYAWKKSDVSQSGSFTRDFDSAEKLEKFKFYALTAEKNYQLEIGEKTITYYANYAGLQTIDLSSENIIITDATIDYELSPVSSGTYFITNSGMVYTSNVDDSTKEIQIDTDQELELPSAENGQYSFKLPYKTRNINSNETINIAVATTDGNGELEVLSEDEYYTVSDDEVAENNALISLDFDENIPDGIYSIVAYVGDIYADEIDSETTAFAMYYFAKGNVNDATFSYNADTGGVVSLASETISPFAYLEDQSIPKGSTATSNTGYTFAGWKHSLEDEDYVSSPEECGEDYCQHPATFIPTVVNEDFYPFYVSQNFIATFEEQEVAMTFATEIDDPFGVSAEVELSEELVGSAIMTNVKIATGSITVTAKLTGDKAECYDFLGWFNGDTKVGTELAFSPQKNDGVYEEATYVAKFAVKRYTVEFKSNNDDYGKITHSSGGDEILNVSLARIKDLASNLSTDNNILAENIIPDSPNSHLAEPMRSTAQYSYRFDNWTYSVDALNKKYIFTATFSNTVNTYDAMFHYNGHGGEDQILNEEYGTTINVPTPSDEIYDFKGWYTDPELTNIYDSDTITISANTNLYAKWEIKHFSVIININGSENGSIDATGPITVDYGDTINISDNIVTLHNQTITATPKTTTAEYKYEFVEWVTSCSGSITSNCELTATFRAKPQVYILTIDTNNGGEKTEFFVPFGDKVSDYISNPIKLNYDFGGWENYSETMTAHDLTLKAKWNVKTPKINSKLLEKMTSNKELIIKDGTEIIFDTTEIFILNLRKYGMPNLTFKVISELADAYTMKTFTNDGENELNDSDILGTGSIIKFYGPEGEEIEKMTNTLILVGDIDGDGKMNDNDFSKVKSSIIKKSSLSGIYHTAADYDCDDKITSADYVKMKYVKKQ